MALQDLETAPPLLRAAGIARSGLAPADLTLNANSCCAVMGPSGSGKSMLLRAIADLDPHDGEAYLNGVACSAMSGPVWRSRVTYVAAEPGWWAETVGPHMASAARARELIGLLGLDESCLDAPVSRLSTGERQRLALVRALIQVPDVLLLDEPTAALDTESRDRVADLLETRQRQGLGLVIATHDRAFAERLGEHLFEMRSGHLEPAAP